MVMLARFLPLIPCVKTNSHLRLTFHYPGSPTSPHQWNDPKKEDHCFHCPGAGDCFIRFIINAGVFYLWTFPLLINYYFSGIIGIMHMGVLFDKINLVASHTPNNIRRLRVYSIAAGVGSGAG